MTRQPVPRWGWGWIVGVVIAIGWAAAPALPVARAQEQPDPRFGVVEAYESPADAAALGAAWTRVRFQWAEVQPDGPDSWAPPLDDARLAAEVAAGRQVIGMLIGIPAWARGPDRLPAGLWHPPDDPANLWAAFVRQAAGRYAGVIDHWIIWNEPDIWDPAAPGHTWDGDEDDFLQLQRVAYHSARAANPAAVLHLAAMTYFWDAQFGREQYLDRLLDRLVADPEAAAHGHYFDVATAHLYFQPNTVYDVLSTFGRLLADHGLDKPIWLVETNAPPADDPTWPVGSVTLHVSQSEQAAFMPQALAIALAAGAERVAIYKLQDTEDDLLANPEPFGLVRRDGSRRPAFAAARLAFGMLAGVVAAERERWDEVGQVRLIQGDRVTTVLFARLPAPQSASVPALAETARLVDMHGAERLIRAREGAFQVALPRAACSQSIGDYCMIGGAPFYLVQSRDGGPPPPDLPAPLPALSSPRPTDTTASPPSPTATATRPPTPSRVVAAAPVTSVPEAPPKPTPSATRLAAELPPVPTNAPATAASPPATTPSPGWWLGAAGALGLLAAALVWRKNR